MKPPPISSLSVTSLKLYGIPLPKALTCQVSRCYQLKGVHQNGFNTCSALVLIRKNERNEEFFSLFGGKFEKREIEESLTKRKP
jgi:hypothetical protein